MVMIDYKDIGAKVRNRNSRENLFRHKRGQVPKISLDGMENDSSSEDQVPHQYEDVKEIDDLGFKDEEFLKRQNYHFDPENEKLPREFKFRARKGHELDRAVYRAVIKIKLEIPLIRLDNERYLIGTEPQSLKVFNGQVAVKLGSGWEPLLEFLKRISKERRNRLIKLL